MRGKNEPVGMGFLSLGVRARYKGWRIKLCTYRR